MNICLHDKPFNVCLCIKYLCSYMHIAKIWKTLIHNYIYISYLPLHYQHKRIFLWVAWEKMEMRKFLRVFSHLFYILFENESSSLKNVQKPFFIFLSTFLIYTFDHIFKVTFLRFKIQRNYFCIRGNLKGGRNNIIRVFENLRNNFQTVFFTWM